MVSHDETGPARPGAARTGGAGGWRSWRQAWDDAAYGEDGFWSREQPGAHFTTGVGVGAHVARAVAALAPAGVGVVVDVGAGDGRLVTALAPLLPGVGLVGVDRRARPDGLDPRVGWVVDHWDAGAGRWQQGGPERWCATGARPLLVAHEWLDDLPATVAVRERQDWHEVWHAMAHDGSGRERQGRVVAAEDAAWLDRWWPGAEEGSRAEVGSPRDAAWADLVAAAVARGGRALAVDYGHLADGRPRTGSLTAYAAGRQRSPVADGSVNLTAGVAVDALEAAGRRAGGETLLLARQAEVLADLAADPQTDASASGADPLAALVRRSELASLTAPGRWGPLWWLLQGAAAAPDAPLLP
ncbi:SAM-dependent methyltransferase [Microlunatus flavus]|uniref:SAM-dependent methyltransferase, MidA family n=1 Tax=Microlunatus flavus TaxID=1036181 RepID=A0A1H8Z8M2_9ACTN|nr:SAM-dependent methyltransferase [Microlunatus flavus]SEP60784.1 SAM-dependent methyltransferase, MidA family [Microlunatus flavus]